MNKLSFFLAAVAALASGGSLAAQSLAVVRAEESADKSNVVFSLSNKNYAGTISVFLTFDRIRNSNSATPGATSKYEARSDRARLMTLTAADKELGGIGYSYSYRLYPGRIDSPVDTAFVYRMPCTTRRPVEVHKTVSVMEKYSRGQDDRKQIGTYFVLEKGDTVYAMRRGVVARIDRPKSSDVSRDVRFTTESLDLLIEHPDGSEGRYICFDPGHLFVEEGSLVLPGTPLGLAGAYDQEEYHISVQLIYHVSDPADPKHSRRSPVAATRHFLPLFATAEGSLRLEHGKQYTAVMNDDLLTADMSKREIKKLKGNKK